MPFKDIVKAIYTYEASAEDEISFLEDDVLCIVVGEEPETEWLSARPLMNQDLCGLIPINYIESMDAVAVATAMYAYDAQEDNELCLKEGEQVFILSKLDNDDWWLARNDQGLCGLVPYNYVEDAGDKGPSVGEKIEPVEDESSVKWSALVFNLGCIS